jgi:hypothetical protein
MKLLHITSDSENCIDECLMIVPDDFDKKYVLDEAESAGIELPTIESSIDVDPDDFRNFSEYRTYVG